MSYNNLSKKKIFNFLKKYPIIIRYKLIFDNILAKIKFMVQNDKQYAKRNYWKLKHQQLNLKDPLYFSEKLQYLKLYYRNPLMTLCADKYYAREYVKLCGFERILKKIYAVYNDVKEINLEVLPEKSFIHWNHLSGGNFVLDKTQNVDKVFCLLKAYKNMNWYIHKREWPYKNIQPKLICEEFLHNEDGSSLIDYKFYCFNGKVKYYMVSMGEYEHLHQNHKFSRDGKSIDYLFKEKETLSVDKIKLPHNINEMIDIADKLSKPFPHARVDLYNINGRVVFGEITFFSNSGFVTIESKTFDKEIGSWIDLKHYCNDMRGNKNVA